ncbi:unnamed protein product [Protopolystoma xenopodis]|uniref:Uncharacterized protein n=1 Tax=Protopolystoma xenopodis TaxID=117903 RepID=A0A3S5FF35_9PLAT|nr:unnamed protein product [Protopolystoma xenopodis]
MDISSLSLSPPFDYDEEINENGDGPETPDTSISDHENTVDKCTGTSFSCLSDVDIGAPSGLNRFISNPVAESSCSSSIFPQRSPDSTALNLMPSPASKSSEPELPGKMVEKCESTPIASCTRVNLLPHADNDSSAMDWSRVAFRLDNETHSRGSDVSKSSSPSMMIVSPVSSVPGVVNYHLPLRKPSSTNFQHPSSDMCQEHFNAGESPGYLVQYSSSHTDTISSHLFNASIGCADGSTSAATATSNNTTGGNNTSNGVTSSNPNSILSSAAGAYAGASLYGGGLSGPAGGSSWGNGGPLMSLGAHVQVIMIHITKLVLK